MNGMVAQARKSSVWEIEAGASRAQDQLELHVGLYLKQQKMQKGSKHKGHGILQILSTGVVN